MCSMRCSGRASMGGMSPSRLHFGPFSFLGSLRICVIETSRSEFVCYERVSLSRPWSVPLSPCFGLSISPDFIDLYTSLPIFTSIYMIAVVIVVGVAGGRWRRRMRHSSSGLSSKTTHPPWTKVRRQSIYICSNIVFIYVQIYSNVISMRPRCAQLILFMYYIDAYICIYGAIYIHSLSTCIEVKSWESIHTKPPAFTKKVNRKHHYQNPAS